MVRYWSAEGCASNIGSGRSGYFNARSGPCAARLLPCFERILEYLDAGQCGFPDLGFGRQGVGLRIAQEYHDKRPAACVDHTDIANDPRERTCLMRGENILIE